MTANPTSPLCRAGKEGESFLHTTVQCCMFATLIARQTSNCDDIIDYGMTSLSSSGPFCFPIGKIELCKSAILNS